MAGKVDGLAIASIVIGGVMAWSGIENQTIANTLKSVLSGQVPTPGAGQNLAVTEGSDESLSAALGTEGGTAGQEVNVTTPGSGNAAANQALGRLMAAGYGWTGQQFTDLVALWNRESGWNAAARNPSSGAFGIAQALGHGTAATKAADGTNEYGGYGVSAATAKAANGGSAAAQIAWGLAYIRATYGSPTAAEAHENANGWY